MATRSYKTIQGDTWDAIALKMYGEERYMHEIIKANSKHNNIVIFPANIVVLVPDIVIPEYNNLPPWKR